MHRFLSLFRHGATRGVAAVEFALIAPVLVALLGATTDLGRGIERAIMLETAARSGAEWLGLNPFDALANDVSQAAVRSAMAPALTGLPNATVTVSNSVCLCPDANGRVTGTPSVGACGTACATGIARFRTIRVSEPFNVIFPTTNFIPGSGTRTIERRVTVRL